MSEADDSQLPIPFNEERVQKWGIPAAFILAGIVCFIIAFAAFGDSDCTDTCRDFSCVHLSLVCSALNCSLPCLSDQLECTNGTRHCVYDTWFFVFLFLSVFSFVALIGYMCPTGCY